jgi:hypothetical protein
VQKRQARAFVTSIQVFRDISRRAAVERRKPCMYSQVLHVVWWWMEIQRAKTEEAARRPTETRPTKTNSSGALHGYKSNWTGSLQTEAVPSREAESQSSVSLHI